MLLKKENVKKLGLEELNKVSGGIILDKKTYFMILNTTGMSTVISKVYYGKKGQLTEEEAYKEAERRDNIDYSTY